jgi:hypothetical protein
LFQRSFLTGLAVTLLVVQACGSDDGKKKTIATDAGMGGEAGAEATPDSGGSSAGEPPLPMGGEPNAGTGGTPDPGMAGMPPVSGGAGGEAPYVPQPELLFSVKPGAVGLENTGIQTQTNASNAIYTSNTGSQNRDDGTNAVKVLGADLGLGPDDSITAFTQLQAEPQNPMYLLSVAEDSEGGPSSRINADYAAYMPTDGHVYFSDGATSWVYGEGGENLGYNGLLATEASLGLWPGDAGNADDLTGLLLRDAQQPLTELYFTVDSSAVGATGSAVESVAQAERGCTLFKSALDGTNTVALSCANLGLVASDQLDALAVYGDQAPDKVLFSVRYGSQGAIGTAVEASRLAFSPTSGAVLFESPGDGTNTLLKDGVELGLSPYPYYTEDVDGLAVIDAPAPTIASANTCNITHDLFDVAEGALTSVGGAVSIGGSLLMIAGQTASAARVIAYNPATCAYIQQKDMPSQFYDATGLGIVPLAGWTATAPLDNVEYWRLKSAPPGLERYDAAGTSVHQLTIDTIGIDYYANPVALLHEPVGDRLYLLFEDYYFGGRLQLAVLPRPDNSTTSVSPSMVWLSAPCATSPKVTGLDGLGNLYVAQHQGPTNTTDYRVCVYRDDGELQLAPYWWTPNGPIEQAGFIVGGGSHFLLSTNSGAGPSAIERGVFQAP